MAPLLRASVGLWLLTAGLGGTASGAVPLQELAGAWARYTVVADPSHLPRIDTIVVSTPGLVPTPDGDALWFRLEALRQGEPVFAIALLASDMAFLEGGGPPLVHRYVLFPAKGGPLEYVDAATGRARLPRFGLFTGLLPRASPGSGSPLPRLEEFLGRPLILDRAAPTGAKMLPDPGGWRTLSLDDRVLIASSRHFRDDGTGREWDAQRVPPQFGDYRYVPLEPADYHEMMEAGFNLFRLPIEHLDHVLSEPVFFMLYDGTPAVPDLLYRSNYYGCVQFMDEPEIQVLNQPDFADVTVPEVAAQRITDYTAEVLEGASEYGSRYLAELLAREGWELGPHVDVTEPWIPSWIAYVGTGWYQMEAGVRALIHECRIVPGDGSASTLQRFNVDFPAQAEPWIRFELGMVTGAAACQGGEWGVSVFGQMEEAASYLLFPMAYERGARFFWLWTSDYSHHVPHERQLAIVRHFREWLGTEPGFRPRQSRPLVAITLPWGYTCDRSNFKGDDPGFLWWRSQIRLDGTNPSGTQHRNVLAAVYRTFLERIDAGEEVDLVYEGPGPGFPGGGYAEVYHVRLTGLVEVGATGVRTVAPVAAAAPLAARPNPFRTWTDLGLEGSRSAPERVAIFDAGGRLVRTLRPGTQLPGAAHDLLWDGCDDAGRQVPSGVYFARALVEGAEANRKIVRLR